MAETERWRNRITGHGEVAPDQLLANPDNWRIHPKGQQSAMAGILDEIGWIAEVIVNERTGFVLDGHMRVAMAIARGEPTVPVRYVDLSEAEEKLALATYDPVAAMFEEDKAQLDALLRQTTTGDARLQEMLSDVAKQAGLNYAGLQVDDSALEEDEGADEDHAEELRQAWQTAPGQLWIIPSLTVPGRAHRLLCGDSTDAADVRRLMNGERAILFATDPPYAVSYDATNHPHKWGEEDKNKHEHKETYKDWDTVDDPERLYNDFMRVAREEAIEPDAAWYCWHAGVKSTLVQGAFEANGAFVHQQIVWVKDRPILSRTWYMWQHEPCFFGWVRPNKPPRVIDEYPRSVWQIPTIKPGQKTDHPTSKPIEVFAIPIEQHTRVGQICYEPFSGSGSQHVAAEQAGRLCYGLEREPRYVAVILERLKALGLAPVLAAPVPA